MLPRYGKCVDLAEVSRLHHRPKRKPHIELFVGIFRRHKFAVPDRAAVGNFDLRLRFPNLTDQFQSGKVGTDFRLLVVVCVAVGTVVEQFHNGNVKACAAVGFTKT